MSKQIVIAEQHRIAAVFSEDQIQEIIVATGSHQVGDIYLGTVENILPGIDACFVNIGDSDKNGFMHVSDLGPLKLKRMASSITELLAPQQKVLVQIMKEPTGNKGPRLTGKVTLPGRYLVLMPYGRGVNLSRRIRNEAERNRLRALGILIKPAGTGLLIRTEAEGVSEEAIIEDLESLQKRWDAIQQEAMATRPPSLLNRDDDFIQKVLRDVYNDDVNRIVTDTESGLARTKKHLSGWSDGRIPANILVDYHKESTHILEYFRVNAAIREALKPRVDLPSGGYIIIEPTEALTVIDVNSGSFTRSATARETVLWTNCEAAVEIARQMRLRNIAGVIVVDFIDMDSRRDQMQVLEQFGKAIRADKSRPQISQLSELGLVELTRKRQGQNIYELFGKTCPTCGGLGLLAQLPGEEPDAVSQVSAISGGSSGGYSSPAQSYSSRPSARDNRGDRSVNLAPQSELQELDLLNHPSYQDKNGRGGRRRRRRGGSDSPATPSRSGSASPVQIDRADRNGDDRKRRRGGNNRFDDRNEKDRLDRDRETSREAAQTEGKSANADSSRGKRTRNNRRKPEEPQEIVAVEMPIEEQRIYAMMGVSPLAYSEQTVENPQNALISVVLPGEAENFLAEAKAKAEEAKANKRVIETPARLNTSEVSTNEEGVEPAEDKSEDESFEENLSSESTARSDETSNEETGSEETESSNQAEKKSPVRRRRRSKSASSAASSSTAKEKRSEDNSATVAPPTLKSGDDSDSPDLETVSETASSDAANADEDSSTAAAEKTTEKKVVRRRRRRSSAS
ncbi:MAG: Rne/Rng family ribonuclease [Cyanobacteria bacterium J06621_11]